LRTYEAADRGSVTDLDATAVSAKYNEAVLNAHSHLDPIGQGSAIDI
jgi:hypothetical protein